MVVALHPVLLREPMEITSGSAASVTQGSAAAAAPISISARVATPPPTAQVSTPATTTSKKATADIPAEITSTTAPSDTRPSDESGEPGEDQPATQRSAGPANRPSHGEVTIHNTLAVRHASTRNQSTQWYLARSISCVDRQGQVHHFQLQAEHPGQTAVPWRFSMHISGAVLNNGDSDTEC